jgi:1-acyl-sn-glycerol-3-phosphate acyltransferase
MDSRPTIPSALAAMVTAMRSGYGPNGQRPSELPDGGHDPSFLEKTAPLLEFVYSRYFRVRTVGMERVPLAGPALLVANHSGGIPYDGTMLIYALYRDHPAHRRLRTLVANFAFHSIWMENLVTRVGGVRASTENALPLLQRGDLVAVFPEGLKGVGKLYRERYRLNRFGRGGFVRLAREARVPIIPVAIVGAEEIHPVLTKLTKLAEPLGLPYIPITPTFPLLGPLGLLPVPTKWTIQFGDPIDMIPGSDPETTNRSAEEVRERIDEMIADLLTHRRSVIFG